MIDVDDPTLLKLLSERLWMVDGGLFVGRRDAIRLLADTQLAWIYGPGRTGKSSLARRLVEGRGRIAWIDTGDIADGDLNEALRRVAVAAGVESENPRMGYERVMRSGVLGAV